MFHLQLSSTAPAVVKYIPPDVSARFEWSRVVFRSIVPAA